MNIALQAQGLCILMSSLTDYIQEKQDLNDMSALVN